MRNGKPEVIEVCRTVHGPVLEWDDREPVAYSLKRAFRGKELETMRAIAGFWTARTLDEFAASAKLIWLTHNFFVATVEGDIGYWHCGRPPQRADGVDPRLPTPGIGEKEWKGVLAPEADSAMDQPKAGIHLQLEQQTGELTGTTENVRSGARFSESIASPNFSRLGPKLTFEQIRDIAVDIGLNDPVANYVEAAAPQRNCQLSNHQPAVEASL